MHDLRRFDIVTLGETMLRIVPPPPLRLGQSERRSRSALAARSRPSRLISRGSAIVRRGSRACRTTRLGAELVRTLRGYGVDCDDVVFDPQARLGLYFVELGPAPRGIQVWYDRKHSAASLMRPEEIPAGWIEQARWLHLTGITPALSDTCAQTTHAALDRARAAGLTVSFDVNYRALLWPPQARGRRPRTSMQSRRHHVRRPPRRRRAVWHQR
ncbi:MAG: hypothetical protein HND48_25540 [Chloroflexi bacterium]|nr:hypothetical protein [Chloroflexota bacterium]